MSDVLQTIKTRRSIRKFKADQITKEQLEAIVTAGLYAPSAKNTQNWQLTVVQGEEKLELLRAAIAEEIGVPNYPRFYNAPTLIFVSTPKDYDFGPYDSSLVLENIFLEANALGVGSVWINQLLNIGDKPSVRKVLSQLKLPENHKVWGIAALGYADGEVNTDRVNKGVVVYA